MHGKESVIAPVLERVLGVHCTVPVPSDTDRLGTFTGEVERRHDPVTTARLKCLGAMDLTGADLGIASEGSFGPAPGAFFLSCDEEWVILVDRKLQLEIVVMERSLETNYNGAVIHSLEELQQFASAALFPAHGLILRKWKTAYNPVYKGIHDPEQLEALYAQLKGTDGSCYVETDMRALHNPTRMRVISRAAQQLTARAATFLPGMWLTRVRNYGGGIRIALCPMPPAYPPDAVAPHSVRRVSSCNETIAT